MLIAEDGENVKSQKEDIARIATGKYWVNNHAHIVESNGLCDLRYLCYLLNSTDISGYITGSAQPKLNQANLLSIEIELPSLEDQKIVADILSSFDDKIELNNRINHNLEEQAQALYKSWFVDFEPFKDGKFVESELGLIPEGWKAGKIIDLATISSGKRPRIKQANEDADYNIPIIGASGVMAYTDETLIHRDVLVTGRVGTLGIIQRLSIPCWPSDNTLLIDSEYKSFMYNIWFGKVPRKYGR